MTMPEQQDAGYGQAAEIYWNKGWRGVLPLKPRQKFPPPDGRTGHSGIDPSYPDILQYCELYPDGNLALRMPEGVIGIDVDAYESKNGGATLAEAEKRWGKLPPTAMTSSRYENGDRISGIRYFRVPAGTYLVGVIEFPELGLGNIEIIQRHHRYAVVWPSIHKDTGLIYWWYNHIWQLIPVPSPETFAWLPQGWIEPLQVNYANTNTDLSAEQADALIKQCLTEGEMSLRVANKLYEAILEIQHPGASRHDAVLRTVLTLLRYGKDGESGVFNALVAYRNEFVKSVTAPGQRLAGDPDAAQAEFRRMIDGPNAARELAQPSHNEWMKGLGEMPQPAQPTQPQPATTIPAGEETAPGGEPGGGGEAPQPAEPTGLDEYLENAIRARMGTMRVDREAKRRLDELEHPSLAPPPIKGLTALLAEPDLPTPYRIDQLSPAGGRTLLAAQYKAGKSSTVGNLIRSLVDGDPFLGRFNICETSRSLVLIDTELSENTLRLWLRQQGINNTAAVADVMSLRGKLGSFNIVDDRTRAQWATRLADLGADYLILDCLRPALDAIGLDEHSDVGIFLTAFDALLDEAGVPDALLVHHMGHSGERSRGDSRLQDWPDSIWTIVRENENPASDRFFRAYGRDVDLPEGRLIFNTENRHLTFNPGSRGDTKVEAAALAVIDLLAYTARTSGEALSGNAIESQLKGEHGQKNVRQALERLFERGVTRVETGARNAKIYRISSECSECRLPVSNGQSRHFSCPSDAEGALL